MADSACLTCEAAAGDGAFDIELTVCMGSFQRLTNDQLEGFETEIIIDCEVIDLDFAGSAREQSYSCNRGLSSAGSVEICFLRLVHY